MSISGMCNQNYRSGLITATMGEIVLDLNLQTEYYLIGSKILCLIFSCTGVQTGLNMLIVTRERACSLLIWCGMLWRPCIRQDSTGLECWLYANRVKLGKRGELGVDWGWARARNQQHTRITFYSESWWVTLSCEDIYAVVKWDGMKRDNRAGSLNKVYMSNHILAFTHQLFWVQVGKTPSKQVCLIDTGPLT